MWYGLRVPTVITPLVALGRPDAANLRELVPTREIEGHHPSLSIAGLRFHQNAHQLIQLRLHLRDPHQLNLLLLLNTLELLSDLGYLVDVLQRPLHLVL